MLPEDEIRWRRFQVERTSQSPTPASARLEGLGSRTGAAKSACMRECECPGKVWLATPMAAVQSRWGWGAGRGDCILLPGEAGAAHGNEKGEPHGQGPPLLTDVKELKQL